MKLTAIHLDDEELPETFTFTVTRDEAALLYNLTGRIGPLYVTNAAGGDARWAEACGAIARCVGSAFNGFYENGVDEVIPRFGIIDIAAKKAEATP